MNGKEFEKLIQLSCEEQGVDITRFRDAGFVGDRSSERRFTPKNICDFVIFTGDRLFYVEAKKRGSALRFDDITQLDDLVKKEKSLRSKGLLNAEAGILVYFENKNQVWWVNIYGVLELQAGSKKSFNSSDLEGLSSHYTSQVELFTPMGKRKNRLRIDDLSTEKMTSILG